MNTDQLAEFYTPYVSRLTTSLERKYHINFVSIDPEKGLAIERDRTVSADDFKRLIRSLAIVRDQNRKVAVEMERYIGQAILDYSARNNVDWSTAISQLELPSLTGRSFKTISKLPRIVSMLPDDIWSRCPNLSISHFDAATSFAGPDHADFEAVISFSAKRDEILVAASSDPSGIWSKNDIALKMRELQADFNVPRSRDLPVAELRLAFERLSLMLIDWEDDDIAHYKLTRQRIREAWVDLREQLIQRNVFEFSDTVVGGFRPPMGPVVDAEVIDGETDNADDHQEPPEGEAQDQA